MRESLFSINAGYKDSWNLSLNASALLIWEIKVRLIKLAELGIDVTDAINFAFQTVPGRDDVPPTGILTFQANPNLELSGSYDSNGDWKSQVQLFFRY